MTALILAITFFCLFCICFFFIIQIETDVHNSINLLLVLIVLYLYIPMFWKFSKSIGDFLSVIFWKFWTVLTMVLTVIGT